MPILMRFVAAACFLSSLFAFHVNAQESAHQSRSSLWIDIYQGEPVTYDEVLDDLAIVDVVYLGERHTLERHHAIQADIVRDLASRDVPLLLGLEQMESVYQSELDRYAQGVIDFEELALKTDWSNRWSGYEQYRDILEAARDADAMIIALNARKETIRQVAMSGGLAGLDPATRDELPDDVLLDDPVYTKLLGLMMPMHTAATQERLRPMFEAQICRDAAMADVLCRNLRSEEGRGRTAIVICGAGHVSYGLGTPDRVRRRMPNVKERIILLSESGDVELTEAQRAVSRPVVITHEQLREIGRPIADYFHVTELKSEEK